MDNIIGERIRKIRALQKYTQEDIAGKLGITGGAYAKIERGETDPAISRLFELAKIFDVDINAIIKGETEPKPEKSQNEMNQLSNKVNKLVKEMEKIKNELAASKVRSKKK